MTAAIQVWFREDIVQRLNAARIAGQSAMEAAGYRIPQQPVQAGNVLDMEAYWRGYDAALRTIAAGFGLGSEGKE